MIKYILPVLFFFALATGSCKVKQKEFVTILSIEDSAVTNLQIDTAVQVLQKRLKLEKLEYSTVVANYSARKISIQSEILDKDWIRASLLKRGALVFYECYSLAELAGSLKEADTMLALKIQKANTGIVLNPLFQVLQIAQPYGNTSQEWPPNIGIVLKKDLPLFKKYIESVKEVFPADASILLWERTLEKNNEKYYEVYFVKENDSKFVVSNHVEKASVKFNEERPAVTIALDAYGAHVFKRMTTKNVNRTIAIVIDGNILSAPKVIGPIEGGNISLSSAFKKKEALGIANILQSGYLPLQLQLKNIEELKKAE